MNRRTSAEGSPGSASLLLGFHLASAMAGVLLAGCGDGRPRIVPTSGQVLMNGKPLTARAATGRIDPADGRFALTTYEANDGCVEGTHPAAVIVNTTVGTRLVWIAPERYGDDATSGLTVDIKGDKADVEIRLEGGLAPVPKASEADRRLQESG